MCERLVKQTIVKGNYKNPVLQLLSEMDYFFISTGGLLFDQDRQPIRSNFVQLKLGSLK